MIFIAEAIAGVMWAICDDEDTKKGAIASFTLAFAVNSFASLKNEWNPLWGLPITSWKALWFFLGDS